MPVHSEGRHQFQEIVIQSCNQLPNMKASTKFTSRRFTDSECSDDHKYTLSRVLLVYISPVS